MQQASWTEAFTAVAEKLRGVPGERVGAVAGDLCDAESMAALKDLMAALGSPNLDCRQDGAALDASRREFYLFNSSVAAIDEADAILIVGSNPRREAPVLNSRIRRRWTTGTCPVAYIGPEAELTYGALHLGDGPAALGTLLRGEGEFAKSLKDARRPMVIVGTGALARPDGAAVLAAAWKLAAGVGALTAEWHGFNVLNQAAARVGALDLGFLPGPGGKALPAMLDGGMDVLWLLGADELDTSRIPASTFVVYQGHHGDRGAARADVILPGCAYTEKNGTYINLEGRAQRGYLAVNPPGEAREDWKILRAFSELIGRRLPYDDIAALRRRLAEANPVFGRIGELTRLAGTNQEGPAGDPGGVSEAPFSVSVPDYYQTNPISRASTVMAECSRIYVHGGALGDELPVEGVA